MPAGRGRRHWCTATLVLPPIGPPGHHPGDPASAPPQSARVQVRRPSLGAVGLVFRSQLRQRWRSWLAVAVLVSIVGGVIMAAAAAGRRTESAFPSFVAAHGFDAEIYSLQPAPVISRLPGVSAVTEGVWPRQRSTDVLLHAPAQPLLLRSVGCPRQGKTGLQAGVGPHAGSVEPLRGAGHVHPSTR